MTGHWQILGGHPGGMGPKKKRKGQYSPFVDHTEPKRWRKTMDTGKGPSKSKFHEHISKVFESRFSEIFEEFLAEAKGAKKKKKSGGNETVYRDTEGGDVEAGETSRPMSGSLEPQSQEEKKRFKASADAKADFEREEEIKARGQMDEKEKAEKVLPSGLRRSGEASKIEKEKRKREEDEEFQREMQGWTGEEASGDIDSDDPRHGAMSRHMRELEEIANDAWWSLPEEYRKKVRAHVGKYRSGSNEIAKGSKSAKYPRGFFSIDYLEGQELYGMLNKAGMLETFKQKEANPPISPRTTHGVRNKRDKDLEDLARTIAADKKKKEEEERELANALSPEQERDIDDEGYNAGYYMKVPSYRCPYPAGTRQCEVWKAGYQNGAQDRKKA